ncbi:MAG: DUF2076 domain-containing protein [Proteobacteria bacterium]|nr:DUF2076 domain-containing protein [Pseudomonadota bacterium]
MQPEERDLIGGLFGRLKPFENQPRDPDADRLIGSAIASQPGAPYLLVQTVLVQEQALKAAQDRIAELEAKTAAAPAPGFLASAPKIGPWGRASVPSTPAASPAAAPPQAQMGGGGGFLRQALTTAAGVAGGALLFEGIRNMLGHNPGPFGASSANAMMPPMPSDTFSSTGSSADLAQDDGAADDYDLAADDSGNSGFDDSEDV